MEMLKIEVAVPKEIHELATGIAAFVLEIMREIKSNGGWTVGDDLPGLAVAALALMPALTGFVAIGDEFKNDLSGCITAITLSMAKVLDTTKV